MVKQLHKKIAIFFNLESWNNGKKHLESCSLESRFGPFSKHQASGLVNPAPPKLPRI